MTFNLKALATKTTSNLLRDYRGLIEQYLRLNVEVGGIIDVNANSDPTKYFVFLVEGTELGIDNNSHYPYDRTTAGLTNFVLINWHTHP
jgi:hypothetical protein